MKFLVNFEIFDNNISNNNILKQLYYFLFQINGNWIFHVNL